MTSVNRNTHIPKVEESSCWALSSKWWRNPGSCGATRASLSANFHLLLLSGVVIGRFGHHRLMVEVESGGRRRGLLPLQALRVPGILRRFGTVSPGPREIDHRYQVTYGKNRGAC